jgi:DNA-directed RNA polymerase specialized sigma24 family protein
MEKRAKEFLELSAKFYEDNKDKWQRLLIALGLSFDEDIYNDTIIRVYDKLMNEEDLDKTEDEIIAYWFQSFVNNIKRDKKYSRNSKRDDSDVIDLLRDRAVIIDDSHLYYTTIRMLLEKIKREYKQNDYHLFKMYYLSDFTFDEMKEVLGCDVKSKIMRMKKWLRENV